MKSCRYQWVLIFWMLLLFHASAAVRYVNLNNSSPASPYTSWATAATNIQNAIDAATDGDQILVTNGVYQTGGRVVYGSLTNRVVINKAVTVQSVNGPSVTIILGNPVEGNSAVRCVYMTNNATLSGFTLTNGTTRSSGDAFEEQSGGGAWCESMNAILTNCIIAGNMATFSGGGASGGTLNQCLLAGNSTSDPSYSLGGGAISSFLNACTLAGNSAEDGGGAVNSTLNDCLLTGNGAVNGGGGYFSTFNNCTLAGNSAQIGGGMMGGAANNCIVYYNYASYGYSSNYYIDQSGYFYVLLNNCCTAPMPSSGLGNITDPPLFLDSAGGNYRLHINSPCINTGNNAFSHGGLDLDGNPRIVGGTVDIGAYEYQAPVLAIITQPVSQTNLVGQTVSLNVVAESPFALNYQWQFNSNNIAGATNSTLVLSNLQVTNTGIYRVVVSNSLVTVNSSNAILSVVYPTPAIVQQPTNLAVVIGSNAMFSVIATSYLTMSFQWQLNGTNLVDGGDFTGSTNPTLLVSGTQIADAGTYQVIVANSDAAVTSAVVTLTVLVPAAITIQPTNRTVISPNNASFNVAAVGTTNLGYQWYFNGAPLVDGGRLSGSTSATLNISSAQTNDNGSYQVVVTNSFSSATSVVATLTVLVPVQIIGQPASQAVLLTSNASFSVTAIGTGLSYQWYFNGTLISDGGRISGSLTPTLSIANVQNGDAGGYTVVVSNILNKATSLTASLTPQLSATASIRYVNVNGTSPQSPYLDWTTAATNIQDAIDAAVSGDAVLVTNGIYNTGGRVVYGSLTNRVVINKAVIVESVNGPLTTTIQGFANNGSRVPTNGDNAVRCVYLTNNAALAGFTLTYGATRKAGDLTREQSGGGAWCESTNALLSNCIFMTNTASYYGGGIYSGWLTNCTLTGNKSATVGGGAAGWSVLYGCVLSGNLATNGGMGGAARNATLNNCTITGNLALYGGGVADCTLNNCLLTGNGSTNGIYGTAGGAAYISTLNNCTLFGNFSRELGAADGCTLVNSIIYYNTNGFYSDCYQCRLTNCCTLSLVNNGVPVNTITNSPVFVNLAGGNYRLQSNSPCINGGTNTYVSGTSDLDGNPRNVGGAVDIGAYEFQTPGFTLPYLWAKKFAVSTDGSLDTDGDGMNNWQEWKAGTNPTNALSVLKMASATPTNNPPGLIVTWQSVSGITYFLQRGTNLTAQPAFSTIQTDITGQAGTTSYTDTTATNGGPYFYRVGVQ